MIDDDEQFGRGEWRARFVASDAWRVLNDAHGLSRHGESWLYTSRGCGFVGPPLRVGTSITITGMSDSTKNDGTFSISAVGTGTFNVDNASGVTATGQTGTGTVTVPPPQNPVFVLTGP